ncbi:MAG: tRNA (guanosine(46)-N7)-methyltransferase TrmB [Pirellulaceae bacterium]|nr:tRNA (guanosine(46)-N7)-methyltransferase TrmB [Pirellulaceae bacterium]
MIKTAAGSSDKLALDVLASPAAWDQLVPAGATIEVEVGSGKGLFLQSAAAERPQHYFLGIELAVKFANRAAERLANSNLVNAKMLRGDAQVFLRDTVPTAAVTRMHVYFPDPWWRNKHKKRRVLNDQAILDIERSLKPGGEFHFWTDVLDYYELICAQVMDSTALIGPKFIPERPASHGMDYTTHFERRARLNGQPIYRALFIKP